MAQSEETLLGPLVIALQIIDVRFVIQGMIGILASAVDAAEITVSLGEVLVEKFDITHADIILLAPRSAQCPIIDGSKRFARTLQIAVGTIIRPQCEKRIVVVHRTGMTDDEAPQSPFGIVAAQLDGTGRQQEFDLLGSGPVDRSERLLRSQKLVPRIAPMPAVEQLAPPIDMLARVVGRSPCTQTPAKQEKPQKNEPPHR